MESASGVVHQGHIGESPSEGHIAVAIVIDQKSRPIGMQQIIVSSVDT